MRPVLALLVTMATACAEPSRPSVPPLTTANPSSTAITTATATATATAAPTPTATQSVAPRTTMTTFAEDLAFLTAHGPVVVLEGAGGARVAVSPLFQGRVMTSAVEPGGASFGWMHREFISSHKTGTAFDNYGGEDRFWLGPEGGQFGLYFAPGKPFTFDAWQVPHAMQEGAWDVASASKSRVTMRHGMTVTNWSGASFDVAVERTIDLLGDADARSLLGVAVPPGVRAVAYASKNTVTNAGKAAWKPETGLLSVWILAMYAPAPDGRVVVPFAREGTGPIVNDAYFGKVPADRLAVRDGTLLFTVDGKLRSKIGLGPSRAKGVLGSYSASQNLLTVVSYDKPARATRYVDSMWEKQKDPYAGDVVNSYNDGPVAPGKPPLGGFYEIETSSPALELSPGQSATHVHRTFHFVGSPDALAPIAKAVLGVSLAEIAGP